MDPRETIFAFLTQLIEGHPCEETWGATATGEYLRCGKPSVAIVKSKDPRAYFMCLQCAWHNVDNRGAVLWFTIADTLKQLLGPTKGREFFRGEQIETPLKGKS